MEGGVVGGGWMGWRVVGGWGWGVVVGGERIGVGVDGDWLWGVGG